MPVSRHSVETHQETSSHASRNRNTRSQLSQLTEPLSTDPGQKSGISMHELISTVKKKKEEKKSAGREWIVKHSLKILTHKEKATTMRVRWNCIKLTLNKIRLCFPHNQSTHVADLLEHLFEDFKSTLPVMSLCMTMHLLCLTYIYVVPSSV